MRGNISMVLSGCVPVPPVTRGCSVNEVQLHGETAGHHDEHAADPRRLAGRSLRRVQASD